LHLGQNGNRYGLSCLNETGQIDPRLASDSVGSLVPDPMTMRASLSPFLKHHLEISLIDEGRQIDSSDGHWTNPESPRIET
jgi:hypothetical protein